MLAFCQHPNGSGLAPKPPENHRYWKLNLRLEVDLLNVHVGSLTITFTRLELFLSWECKGFLFVLQIVIQFLWLYHNSRCVCAGVFVAGVSSRLFASWLRRAERPITSRLRTKLGPEAIQFPSALSVCLHKSYAIFNVYLWASEILK